VTIYSYILVRRDLPHSVQVVQASHAAMETGFAVKKPDSPVHFAVLGVDNQEKLLKYAAMLDKRGYKLELFYEPDYNTGYTALCTHPIEGKIPELGRLELL
jgi:hypothetical protein